MILILMIQASANLFNLFIPHHQVLMTKTAIMLHKGTHGIKGVTSSQLNHIQRNVFQSISLLLDAAKDSGLDFNAVQRQ
jgi:hypothetical protein